ncbi:MAG: hypothetical protein ACFFD4_38535 [Candidatus Odinarchaeota archaeon]
MDTTLPQKPGKFVSLAIKKVKGFTTPDIAYWIATGKITGKLPQLALSCYDNTLYIYSSEGKKITQLDWSTNFTCIAIGDVKGDGKDCLVAGDLNGVIRAIDSTGSLLWVARLGEAVTGISAGDVNGNGVEEILVGLDGNRIVLLSSDGEVLWQKKIPTKLIKTALGDVDSDGQLDIVVVDNIGNIYIYDQRGVEKKTIHLAQKISSCEIVHLGEISCFVTYQRVNPSISFWSAGGNLLDVYYLEGNARIKFLTADQLIGDENDELIVSRNDQQVEILSISVLSFDEEGNPVEIGSVKEVETGPALTKTIKQIIISTTARFPTIKLTELDEIINVTLRKKVDYNLHALVLEMIKERELTGFIRENVFYRT